MPPMTDAAGQPVLPRLGACVRSGAVKGVRSALWLLAFIAPISLGVTLLNWSGALSAAARPIEPAFRLAGLPGETALAFLTGALLNIYSCIAAMGSIALDNRQVTILALAALISHNLPVEVAVQQKAGSSGVRLLLLRLAMSVAAALFLNAVLPADPNPARLRGVIAVTPGLGDTLRAWALGTLWLAGKIAVLVIGLMILQRILAEFGWMRFLSKALYPLLWALGLPRRTAFLWIVANVLGLAYGATIIIEEVKTGELTKEEMEILNRSVAVCHSLLEDTLLFVAIGAWAFWITVPRLALAAGVVWAYRIRRSRGLNRERTGG